jgi:hypothetical protein
MLFLILILRQTKTAETEAVAGTPIASTATHMFHHANMEPPAQTQAANTHISFDIQLSVVQKRAAESQNVDTNIPLEHLAGTEPLARIRVASSLIYLSIRRSVAIKRVAETQNANIGTLL